MNVSHALMHVRCRLYGIYWATTRAVGRRQVRKMCQYCALASRRACAHRMMVSAQTWEQGTCIRPQWTVQEGAIDHK